MLAYDRRVKIVDALHEKSPMHINELIDQLGVTAATIRRDLTYLEESGKIVRMRGMAKLKEPPKQEHTATQPISAEEKEKNAIAAEALKLIPYNATMILDAGTTTLALAKQLVNRPDIRVVTHSVEIATQLADNGIPTIVIGGNLFNASKSCVGAETEEAYKNIEVSLAFLGTSGIQNKKFTTFTSFETAIKKRIIKSADKVIMLACASKFSCKAILPFAEFSDIDCLITTEPLDAAIRRQLERTNIEIIIATP